MRKIAMVLATNGIQYDDRIRKEMLSVMSIYPDIKFKIFALIDGNVSIEECGVSDYGVEYEIPLFRSRLRYPQGTHLLAKLWDFYTTIRPKIKDFDAIWCADFRPLFFLLLYRKPIIWDLHELPEELLGSFVKKWILKFLMKRANVVIHANPERLNYLDKHNALSNKNNQIIIRNFPEVSDDNNNTDDKFIEFLNWKRDVPCIYLQGLSEPTRCDYESIKAIMSIKGIQAVVVGKFSNNLKEKFASEYGLEFKQKLFFTGMIPQRNTIHYIRECDASLVLYKNTNPNNFYCEPNRMFQSIINDCPVVVGYNPPMKELVDKYKFGVSICSDGSKVEDIVDGINKLMSNREYYLNNIRQKKHVISWSHQYDEFSEVISRVFRTKSI